MKKIPKAQPNFSKMAGVAFAVLSIILLIAWPVLAVPAPILLDPKTIPKYVNQLTSPPPVYEPTNVTDGNGKVIRQDYTVDVTSFTQQILPPGFPNTTVWGYGGNAKDPITGAPLGYFRNQPGSTFESIRGIPVNVTWQNKITSPHLFAVDPTLHWANPNNFTAYPPFLPYPPGYTEAQSPVPLIPHLHGAEVQSTYDGHPEAWFTSNGIHGPAYNTATPTTPDSAVFYYPNMQPPTTLWYHDHALGITRINVMSGLAGFYLLRDPADPVAPLLPSGIYEMPLVIQDRTFYANGSFFFPSVGLNPNDHPYWMPEFFGDTIMVNGKVWPNMNVDNGQYRFRILDGSNARFYTISFWDRLNNARLPFTQIGSDGGYLKAPVTLTQLTIAPGERVDILVDFSSLLPGTKIILDNSAKAPFPKGAPADPQTVGQIMQFTVTGNPGPAPAVLPPTLNNSTLGTILDPFPTLPLPTRTRILVLWEVMGPGGPLEILLNGQKWAAEISELPAINSTEEWVIVNPTADTHPIHLHLVQFQLVSRQSIKTKKYVTDWTALNGMPPLPLNITPTELPVTPYLQKKPIGPALNEQGWKDTIQANTGEITVIRIRFAPIDGSPNYPFDATVEPGYVWHCHILDHEDNEMMRPYKVITTTP
ncbi:MAG: multicopper oxidase [Candidatus Bathyarchaeota archaeon]|nr:multicopper oxidase [Candidatus Bathyarchaeota archaeon]